MIVTSGEEASPHSAKDVEFTPLAEAGIAGRRFDDFEVRGGGPEVGAEEGGVVALPGRVDADADVDGGRVASGLGAW